MDPGAVLGVAPGATLQEIREAFRAKARKHHPDHGGDEWAFRVVVRCHEILCTTRVVSHAGREAGAATRRPPEPRTEPPREERADADAERLRPGLRDPAPDPARTVDVEVFVVRYEVSDPTDLFITPPEDRSLCCCLNVSWTAPGAGAGGREHPDAAPTLDLLTEAFTALPSRTGSLSSWHRAEGGRFEGWLSYATAVRAWEAFRTFHEALNRSGLGVNQWTREMVIPRGAG